MCVITGHFATKRSLAHSPLMADEEEELDEEDWGLELVLDDDEGLKVFRKFCEEALADENLNFLLEAREWRESWATTDATKRDEQAANLVATYLAEGAPHQVSLPAHLAS